MMQFIDLQAQLASMRKAIDARIKTVLDHGKFIMGPEVLELEQQLADYAGVKHCVTCANGTDALQIALMAQNIGPGDIVLTTSFSFFATAEVISLVGATPYFVDIDPNTYNMCASSLERAIYAASSEQAGECKAVIAADMFGLPADYPALQRICDKHSLKLIQDGAQSFGASINGARTGTFGDMATTSFFPAKPLGCYGDGGAVFTDSDELAAISRSIRVHGKGEHKYENIRVGLNSRLDTLQAAILLEKLSHFPAELARRQEIADRYYANLGDTFTLQLVPETNASAWAQLTLRQKKVSRERLQQALKDKQVPTAVYYPKPLHLQPAMARFANHSLEVSEALANQVFSVPMHPYMTDEEVDSICQILLAALA